MPPSGRLRMPPSGRLRCLKDRRPHCSRLVPCSRGLVPRRPRIATCLSEATVVAKSPSHALIVELVVLSSTRGGLRSGSRKRWW
jgi:hypothetical protein